MVDELEDAGAAHRALVEALAAEHGNLVCACDLGQSIRRPPLAVRDPAPSFMDSHPDAERWSSTAPFVSAPRSPGRSSAVVGLAEGQPVPPEPDGSAGPAEEASVRCLALHR